MGTIDKLRSPLRYADPENPPCDSTECLLPASVANDLMIEKMNAKGDATALAAWRSKLDGAIAAHRAERGANQPSQPKGDEMCKCNEKRDALEREREARQKMIADSASAYLTRTAPDDTDDAHADDDKPTTPAPGESREAAARRALINASASAYKTGGR